MLMAFKASEGRSHLERERKRESAQDLATRHPKIKNLGREGVSRRSQETENGTSESGGQAGVCDFLETK